MSYHENPVINDLMLTIINDGNGSQCGMDYVDRCTAAQNGILSYRAACKHYSDKRVISGGRRATKAEIIEAATRIQAYYREHVAEPKGV